MNEQEWLASEDPAAMLDDCVHRSHPNVPTYRTPSDRKLRLFAVACLAASDQAELNTGHHGLFDYGDEGEKIEDPVSVAQAWTVDRRGYEPSASVIAHLLRDIVGNPFRPVLERPCSYCKTDQQFRASGMCKTCYPRWFTPTVASLAQAAYDERLDDGTLDPHRLAVLSDAMEEAGFPVVDEKVLLKELDGCFCDDYDQPECDRCREIRRLLAYNLLRHLRSPGPHVRGCWVLDLVLGKD